MVFLCLPFAPRKKSRRSNRSTDSEQMEKLWAAVSYQGTVRSELLRECSAPPVPLGYQEATSDDWQQDGPPPEEVGEQELAYLSEDVESDGTFPAVKLSLLTELLLLIEGHCSLASALAYHR
ncbi:hypothetical protein EOD39_11547 [Acipenser ruthenus]|uniref:Uncharacterized protein n=1 Tax=Acipenser ruthenus TaxID=7906 RepID=A0A444UNE4_ACIRT|nr:hypothetical protein EOD39_11547 [Acipenser ruthenus]